MEQEEKSSPTEPISMENLEEEALEVVEPRRGQLREGVIMDINEEGLVVDIGAKRDGIILNEDFEDLDETFEIGQEIPVVVTNFRDMDGNVELSVSQARLREDWLKAEELKETEEVYETTVLGSNRGGLTIEFGRLRGFIPMSQLIGFNRIRQASERHRRLKAMVGKPIMLKVIEVNPRRRRLILSQLAAAKEWRAARRKKLLNELEAGQIRTGRLSQITDFGLFVNLGGLDGLVHISELSWGRVEDPREIYKVGQRLKVKVLSVDRERQRIALSIKALTPDPWESVPEHYQPGDLVEGKVTQIVDFGVFVELEPGVEGLLHNSELRDPEQREELEPNASILVKVIRVEADRRRIGLSVRQVSRQEWEEWAIESTAKAEEAIEEEDVEATPTSDEIDATEEAEYSDDDDEEYLDDDVIEEEATLEKAQVEA